MAKYILPRDEASESAETKGWLQLAHSLDSGTRTLINFCIQQAAAGSLDDAAEWVRMAQSAGIDDVFEVRIVQFYTEANEALKELGEDDGARKIIEEKISKLDVHIAAATKFRDYLSASLPKQDIAK